jgi:hypothetical protein
MEEIPRSRYRGDRKIRDVLCVFLPGQGMSSWLQLLTSIEA